MANEPKQPQAIQAEEALLGALLINAEMIPRVKAYLEPQAFFLKRHEIIYRGILYVYSKKRAVDLVILNEYLEGENTLDQIGGPGYITGLIEVTITSFNAMAYADEIQAAYTKRLAIDRAGKLVQDIYTSNGNYQEVIASGLKSLREVANLGNQDSQTLNLKASTDYYLDLIEQRQATKDDPKLKFHCWPGLSKLMPELGIGDLVAVLAESGVGKTVFLEQCAEDWARRGWRVAFFHLELNSQTMLDRRTTRHTGIPIARLRDELSDDHFAQIVSLCGEIEKWPGEIHYVHCPGWTSEQIISKAVELDETGGIDVIIVDYFNKIRTVSTDGMNYSQARGYDVETIKNGIEIYGWRGLMAAQFDKAATYKPKKRGSDARDTGELEQKANVVIVIDRQIGEDNQREKCGQIQVVKCNAGREGSIDVAYQGNLLTYGELSTRLRPENYEVRNGSIA